MRGERSVGEETHRWHVGGVDHEVVARRDRACVGPAVRGPLGELERRVNALKFEPAQNHSPAAASQLRLHAVRAGRSDDSFDSGCPHAGCGWLLGPDGNDDGHDAENAEPDRNRRAAHIGDNTAGLKPRATRALQFCGSEDPCYGCPL